MWTASLLVCKYVIYKNIAVTAQTVQTYLTSRVNTQEPETFPAAIFCFS